MLFLIKSKQSLKVVFFFFFTALISQVKSVTVHATNVVLAWRGEINKDKREGRGPTGTSGTTLPMRAGRSAQDTFWSDIMGMGGVIWKIVEQAFYRKKNV